MLGSATAIEGYEPVVCSSDCVHLATNDDGKKSVINTISCGGRGRHHTGQKISQRSGEAVVCYYFLQRARAGTTLASAVGRGRGEERREGMGLE